jgi:hypothetical protein
MLGECSRVVYIAVVLFVGSVWDNPNIYFQQVMSPASATSA